MTGIAGASPNTGGAALGDSVSFRPACVSLDLEVGKEDKRIHAFGAVRGDTGRGMTHSGGGLAAALTKLDAFADGAEFVLGHNLIAFDLDYLKKAKPDLRLLKLPVVDTLRLSPLAFPRNPYHRLVKHYQDGGLKRGRLNDPELDARLALKLFCKQKEALGKAAPDLLAAWHWLCTPELEGVDRALDEFVFQDVRKTYRPSQTEAGAAIGRRLERACATQAREIVAEPDKFGWPLAYAMAWLSVAGGNSVMPPWVGHQFPEARQLVHRLRDIACTDPSCGWCRERHDAAKELKRWFGFDSFRPAPAGDDGKPLQQTIVETAMAGRHALGILPTGTGKSLCYQLPALSRYYKTGALTVVISPLVALMADQVAGLEARGITSCVTVNGLLSMPERANALDRVSLGDAAILLISPEQLRSRSLRRALDQREIGAWVLDEAHCLSRWGHDFRPDYRYVGRFIREKAGDRPVPPVLCLTATAKPDVVDDIDHHFRKELDIGLEMFDGGAERSNLEFEVAPTTEPEKFAHIHQCLADRLPEGAPGGAIVYCATQRRSEEVADFLRLRDVPAEHFHAGVPPETKKEVQRRFIGGELRIIAATNAFGMGIDKPDVRLVVHADIPGSLENYLQEAGRAGRDGKPAHCVLMYVQDDVERQFGMSARSRLTREEIHGVLRALRNLDRRKRFDGDVVATAGEILGADEEKVFERDSATDDNRVRTAIAWLEEARLLTREENVVHVFPSSLRVETVGEARERMERRGIVEPRRGQLLAIAAALIDADSDQGITTDELMTLTGLTPEGVRNALYDLERLGVVSNDTAITAFVHAGVARASKRRLEQAGALEAALIAHMREAAPELEKGQASSLHLRVAAQKLRDEGLDDPLPERLWRILRSIAQDGRGEADGARGSMTVRKRDAETARITLHREWEALEETARLRREAAGLLLDHLLGRLPDGSRGTDLLAETTLGALLHAIETDVELRSQVRETTKLLDRSLLWLHEMEIIRLNKGLAVFRQAMTIRLEQRDRRGFSNADFEPLALHYKGQTLQTHVMGEFARQGLDSVRDAMRLARDYFTLKETAFLERWLPGRDREIGRQTTPDSWRSIVESLGDPVQQRIVADDREQTSVLVLAGPGSGKTRVLVHRIAWLLRVRRENPRGIVALAYNRHSAADIRRRLHGLVGDDARGVTVLTCHGLAMRLAGASFTDRADQPDDQMFREILHRATALLRGENLPAEEADERRQRLLAGFRWILVDEYQDIDRGQYDLIAALAGRTLDDHDSKLTLFAVGDDDQNIYGFNGASVEFIRCFEADYGPNRQFLVDNYRSSGHIVAAANAMIAPARRRMKADRPIRIDKARTKAPLGGAWEKRDPVAQGRVQVLTVRGDEVAQAQAAMGELLHLKDLPSDDDWDWSRCAIVAREWKDLTRARAFCEANDIPAQMGTDEIPHFWRLRETQAFVHWLRRREPRIVDSAVLRAWVDARPADPWHDLLRQAIEENALETGGGETPVGHFIEWLAEWGRNIRRRQRGLLLTTAHGAKGLEFDHVAVLDGDWDRVGKDEDHDATRRLYYVAMTRARQTLTLTRFERSNALLDALNGCNSVFHCPPAAPPPAPPELYRVHRELSLDEVDIGFAGRRRAGDPVHHAIAALSVGDPLKAQRDKDRRWTLRNQAGRTVGRLAKSFKPPSGMRCRSAEVFAIICWSREASDPKYHDATKCDAWEVVVPA